MLLDRVREVLWRGRGGGDLLMPGSGWSLSGAAGGKGLAAAEPAFELFLGAVRYL